MSKSSPKYMASCSQHVSINTTELESLLKSSVNRTYAFRLGDQVRRNTIKKSDLDIIDQFGVSNHYMESIN